MKNMFKLPVIFITIITLIPSLSYQQPFRFEENYEKAFSDITQALDSNIKVDFKHVCFLSENIYFSNTIDFVKFNERIKELKALTEAWMQANSLKNYPFSDSLNFHKNLAIYKVLKDTIRLINNEGNHYVHLPYTYDFEDFFGDRNWSNMFVTKLLATHKGNCHSLPYLYKILADELGATCWLALAPNHMYIQNRCKKIGWYNTELTSGDFPIDAWIMASGYLPLKAVQSGIYMDTLSNQQAIALCVLDLAKGYEHQTKNYYDGFIIKCCDLSLKYFPLNVQAMLLKAETLKRMYEKQAKEKNANAKSVYQEMEALYVKLFDLGYREMPDKMYMQWLRSVAKERDKYSNKQVKATLTGK